MKRRIFWFLIICIVACLILPFVSTKALQTDSEIKIIMDTWEIIPKLENPNMHYLYPDLYEENSEEISPRNFNKIVIPWKVEENIDVWVSGWMLDNNRGIYDTELMNNDLDIVVDDNVFFEDSQFTGGVTAYSDKLRVSFYIAVRDLGFEEGELERLLRSLNITAYIAKYYYSDDSKIEIIYMPQMDMSGIEKKQFTNGFGDHLAVTSLQKVDEADANENSMEKYWISMEEKGYQISVWHIELTLLDPIPRSIRFVFDSDLVRESSHARWGRWWETKILPLDFFVAYKEKEPTYDEVIQLFKDTGLGALATYEFFLDNDGGPYYYTPFNFSALKSVE